MKRPPRRYWHEHRGAAFWLACGLLLLWRALSADVPSTPNRLDEGVHEVKRVVDGDTLLLASGARIRLQGINTPETVKPDSSVEAWGPEAGQFTKKFIENAGNRVRLTFSLERMDRYERFLAFVWDGDTMLNEELVRAGLAYARRDFRYSGAMKQRLTKAQEEAKRAGRGIWSNAVALNANPPK